MFCIKKWGCVQGQVSEFDHDDFTILGCANTQGTFVILSPDNNVGIGLFTHDSINAIYSTIPTNVEHTSKLSPTIMVTKQLFITYGIT